MSPLRGFGLRMLELETGGNRGIRSGLSSGSAVSMKGGAMMGTYFSTGQKHKLAEASMR